MQSNLEYLRTTTVSQSHNPIHERWQYITHAVSCCDTKRNLWLLTFDLSVSWSHRLSINCNMDLMTVAGHVRCSKGLKASGGRGQGQGWVTLADKPGWQSWGENIPGQRNSICQGPIWESTRNPEWLRLRTWWEIVIGTAQTGMADCRRSSDFFQQHTSSHSTQRVALDTAYIQERGCGSGILRNLGSP